MPDVAAESEPLAAKDLEKRRAALEAALSLRPDWAEGHLWLGLTYLNLYRGQVKDWLGAAAGDEKHAAELAPPLWLHGMVHAAVDPTRLPPRTIAAEEPVRRNLLPATRSFLEARRCCPTLALAHAELAQLDYLVADGEPVSVHGARARRLAGASASVLDLVARAALHVDDRALACDCWRDALRARPEGWRAIADASGVALPAEVVLERILTRGSGKLLVLFADRLYGEPEDEAVYKLYLHEALVRLPGEVELPEAERLQLEARAHVGLEQHREARRQMAAALRLEPARSDWRVHFVLWLIQWGDAAEARRQALLGMHFTPDDPDLKRALEAAAEALAQGEVTPAALDRDAGPIRSFE
jgi:hypothetical protein